MGAGKALYGKMDVVSLIPNDPESTSEFCHATWKSDVVSHYPGTQDG